MLQVSWAALRRDHQAAHLVVRSVPLSRVNESPGSQRTTQLALLASLAPSLRLRGTNALAAPPERHGTSVHGDLEMIADAVALSEVVGADGIDRYPGWKTQSSFFVDAETAERVRASLKQRVGKRTLKPRTRALF